MEAFSLFGPQYCLAPPIQATTEGLADEIAILLRGMIGGSFIFLGLHEEAGRNPPENLQPPFLASVFPGPIGKHWEWICMTFRR